jgi:hypothetical protein
MASVNLTCTACIPARPCAACRAIARALQSAGHAVTRTPRYDALRAAMLGAYGFDACILPVSAQEQSVVDAAALLLATARVALVAEHRALDTVNPPPSFTVITTADWEATPFPTDWITSATSEPLAKDDESTRVVPALEVASEDFDVAKQRLKTLASRAQREVAKAGFADERLDALAVLEDEIAWAGASGSGFGIVLVIVPPKAGGPLDMEAVLGKLREVARRAVRSSDAIAVGAESLLVALASADDGDAGAVAQRIANRCRRTVNAKGTGSSFARALRRVLVGFAAYPEHGRARELLIAHATATAKAVKRKPT